MKRKVLTGIVGVILLIGLLSCATFTQNTYKSLFVAGVSYDTAMKSIASLQAQGKITAEQRAEINKYANVYYVSYQTAVEAFIFYEKNKTETAKQAVINALATVMLKWSEFAGYVNRIVPNTLPEKLEVK
uniref:Uncharacterized protein n=1 Tax=Caldisericum exile TaxID=693075 RepID=A0A7C4XS59_9BACT